MSESLLVIVLFRDVCLIREHIDCALKEPIKRCAADSTDRNKSSGAHSVLSRDQMTDCKIILEQPVPRFGESRYLTQLWVSPNEESQDGLYQSDLSLSITTAFEPKAEAVVQGHQTIKKIRAVLKLLTFREEHVLVQFWSPHVVGKHQLLKTLDQPFGLGVPSEELYSYRRDSERNAFFVDKHDEEEVVSPPARVFRRGLPEWTSDVTSYNPKDFPQQGCAFHCNLHGYLALPVFDCTTGLCTGVIEVLMGSKHTTCAYEVKQIHGALKTQNLACPQVFDGPAWNVPRQIEMDKILATLKNVCDIHRLPLAQTWAVSRVTSSVSHDKGFKMSCSSYDTKCIGKVCMSTAGLPFHVRDLDMWKFMEACKERHLDKSRSFVGKVLSSRGSCFCRDVINLNEEEYPLVHYARIYKLTGCFTIFLHSVRGNDDYVLEFFLPSGMEDINYIRHLVQTLKQKFDVHSGFELGDTPPMDFSVLSDSESTVTDISDQGSSTNLSTGKRCAATSSFTDDEETSSPLKKLRIDSVPVPSVTVEVTFEEYVTSFHFPISPGLLEEIKSKVAQRFKLEVEEFTLKYLDDDDDWISILSDADLTFATLDSDSNISLFVQ
ncbi:NIN-like protein [Artemisia annua]|uniref:NIN-like protein n=1 Tax=Artemisia annua TaxID=35608 RepID=A0A2U1LH49_ARTAN|nr:NIN-like protein [Artemisia annua]